MTRTTTHRILRPAAVLAALAIGLGVVQAAAADSGSVGLAKAILVTQFGFSPARADSWTTGACSFRDRPASCYQTPAQARSDSLAQAQSLGVYRNLTPQQAYDWSVGVCSYADKPSTCSLTPQQAVAQSRALAQSLGAERTASSSGTWTAASSSGFGWGAAGIGAAAALGLALLVVGLGYSVVRRRVRPVPHA